MKLSKLKIIMFFFVLLLLLWGLYPRGIFLGYIYEGLSELDKSEKYYLEYLRERPNSKFAVLRLVSLYERMGEPRRALPFLENLYAHRPSDDALALDYLDFLERLHDEKVLYKMRLKVADTLMKARHPAITRITEILDAAFQYAEWHHKIDDQYDILAKLVRVARDKANYTWALRHLDMNLKKADKVVAALQQKVADFPEDLDAREELIGIDIALKRYPEASTLLEEAMAGHPENFGLLRLRIALNEHLRDMPALIRDVRKLLGMNVLSEDEEWDSKSTLAFAYQNNHQLNEALALYREFLDHDPLDAENWLNVIYVFEEMGRWHEVVALLKDYLGKFPADGNRQEMFVDVYLYRLKDLDQLPLYRQYITKHRNVEMALDVANLMIDAKNLSAAIQWLKDMHGLFPRNAETVELLAQLEAGEKNNAVAKSWYTLLAGLRPDLQTQLEVGREIYFLGDPRLAEPYLQKVAAGDPQNGEALAWLSEIHAQSRQRRQSTREARQALALGVDDTGLRRLMQLRVALADQEWWTAMPLLEQMIAETPQDHYLRRDLSGLHHDYDTRVTPHFNFTRYGSDYFWTSGVRFKNYLTHNWELNGDARLGRFVSPSIGYTGVTEAGKVLLTSHHLRPWIISLGVEGAHSPARTTAMPSVELEYRPTPFAGLKLTGFYRELRQDFPQAVAFGTLKDSVQLEGQTVLFDRLVVSARYTFERDYLPSGATAKGQTIEPSASVILFRKPYVTLGWQMDYQRLNSNGNFLNSVPLIPYQNTHYVTGLISGRPISNLLLECGFYNGHDFDRGLNILRGDLWGLRGLFEWAVGPKLDIEGSYEFGRQRLLDIPGYSHVVNVALSAHW